jgi:hypothetical protein
VAFVLWSWIPAVIAALGLAQPIQPAMSGDAIFVIDRVGTDDSRVSEARDSDFKAGDRFSAASLTLDGRLLIYGYRKAQLSDRLALRVLRRGVPQTVIVRPRFVNWLGSMGPLDIALWVLKVVLNALMMTAAGTLALARPGALTRSLLFGLFGTLINVVDPRPIALPGLAMFLIITGGYGFWWYCLWESVRFATRFPDGESGAHGRPLLAIAGAIALLAGSWAMFRNSAGVLYPIDAVSHVVISDGLDSLVRTLFIAANVAIALLAFMAVALRYRSSSDDDRLKLRALLLAFAVVFAYQGAWWLDYLLVPMHRGTTPLDDVVSWSGLVAYLVPGTIFAAILRHRLLGIRFVVDRALVYGGLALLLVAPLRLTNVVLAARFPHTRVAGFAEVAVAIVLAISIDRLRRFIESLLRHTIFREHERVLEEVAEFTREANEVTDRESLERLVQAVGNALALTAAAFLDDESDARTLVPDGDPALVVPLREGRRSAGRLIFGAHRNGSDLDPQEQRALQRFAATAERALERLTLEQLRAELNTLRGQREQSVEVTSG